MPCFARDFSQPRADNGLKFQVAFDRRKKSISFSSYKNCSYHILRAKVDKAFSLYSSQYAIAFKDDDGEISPIETDEDLSDAIQYFHHAVDDGLSAQSGFSGISSGSSTIRRRVTVKVHITVDYDGHLSDACSTASFDDDDDLDFCAGSPDSCLSFDEPLELARGQHRIVRHTASSSTVSDSPQAASLVLPDSPLDDDWLQDQHRLAREASVGVTPPPSDYQISLHSHGSLASSRDLGLLRISTGGGAGERVRRDGPKSPSRELHESWFDEQERLSREAHIPVSIFKPSSTSTMRNIGSAAARRCRRRSSEQRRLLGESHTRLPAIYETLEDSDDELGPDIEHDLGSGTVSDSTPKVAAQKQPFDYPDTDSRPDADFWKDLASASAILEAISRKPIPCDHCCQAITGVRFQCASCPSAPASYNLCASCEPKSYLVHDPMHAFFKLTRPAQPELASVRPLIPPLYMRPAGPSSDDVDSGDPTEYLKDVLHPAVACQACQQQIRGEWYWCAHCALDLCAAHEAVDTHDESHVFVLFKSVVKMSTFRLFAG